MGIHVIHTHGQLCPDPSGKVPSPVVWLSKVAFKALVLLSWLDLGLV
jgi:hypothetical protein